ncbi:universal stress protein [Rhodococcus sp. NPDC003382]|uniref:universal stress protein n=1 Tax=unclassified Rhodococcus (in: high G+C Gram-positive bacteria) TaxID=192944 RepID=UPI0018CD1013|nr:MULTISPECIES: universal stress protein [unclassified Rhodococcus (in: high G+C Gram-positive bacteria)]MBH0121251.1 universal stress protein [Rhodococcus sp. CX]MCK8671264.1 universal stress protein [Rhodococcus sp. HM1]
MTAPQPIVVGVDGSPSSLQAVAWAAKEAARRGAPLTLVTTAIVSGGYVVPIGMPDTFYEEEQLEAERRLAEAESLVAQVTAGHTVEVEKAVSQDAPARELIERSKSARMVVLGANRRGLIERAILGSVSSAVVTHARSPVAVVRGLPHVDVNDISGPVVVGADGSKHSEPAIAMAFEEAAMRGAELVAVHAWSDVDVHAPFPSDFDWAQVEERERATLSESLAGYSGEFPDVPVRTVVVLDRPVRTLRDESEHAQLLVVGSRGRGGFTGLLLGSTSRALLHHVTCPMLVVR